MKTKESLILDLGTISKQDWCISV